MSANCQVGQIRLVSGTSEANGHIEVCSGLKIWAGICDSHWDVRDAEVACRELGLLKHNEGKSKHQFNYNYVIKFKPLIDQNNYVIHGIQCQRQSQDLMALERILFLHMRMHNVLGQSPD